MNIDTSKRSNNKWNGRPEGVKSITIHHWGVEGQKHDNVVNYLCRKGGTTSAHYVVSEGRVNEIVSPDNRAWHSGNARGNRTSIGIECRPEMSQGDYATVVELVRYLFKRYGELPIIGHKDWKNTACPGKWYGVLNSIASDARENRVKAPTETKLVTLTQNTTTITESINNMKATHIFFSHNGKYYCASVLSGLYFHVKDDEQWNGIKRVIEVAGGKWMYWGGRPGGAGRDEVGRPDAFGVEVESI